MIPGLPSMGGMEILIVLAIILLFFGAKRVPELGRSLGRGIREFRQGTAEVGHDADKDQVRDGDSDGEKPFLTGAAHGGCLIVRKRPSQLTAPSGPLPKAS